MTAMEYIKRQGLEPIKDKKVLLAVATLLNNR
jgi:hypothetical protein